MTKQKSPLKNENFYPVALTIAGSDSGGGAGIEADLRTFNAFGVFGCAALTAVTSQTPLGVSRIDPVPAEGVRSQIDAVVGHIAVRYAKTGMLFSHATVEAAADAVKRHKLPLICDPVMVATSGARLLEPDAIDAVRTKLLPLAQWITPNLPEAELLLGHPVSDEKSAFTAARELYDLLGVSVLLKGGHATAPSPDGLCRAVDAVCREGKLYKLSSLRADLPKYASHGTGCTLSSALAAAFALEMPWKEALCECKGFVLGSLLENITIGKGVAAMYPPTQEYMNRITLTEVDEA